MAPCLDLGRARLDRQAAYDPLLTEGPEDETLADIRIYLQQQRALGTDRFREQVQAKLQRFAGIRPAHRPGKVQSRK